MLFLFSRPIEFPGVFAFYYSIIGFVIAAIASEILRRIIFRSKNEPALESSAQSWLAGFAVLGFIFLIGNLILAVPAIVIFFLVHTAVVESLLDSSDATFHRVDNVDTVLVLTINLTGYLLAVRIFHQKIYSRFWDRPAS